MGDNYIIDDLSYLHRALYAKMSTITGVSGLQFLGFDSGFTNPPMPQAGLKISMSEIEVDRDLPTPQESHRIVFETGDSQDFVYDGVLYEDVKTTRKFRYPLPVRIYYDIHCWCHDHKTQLLLDQKIYQTFPERGWITLKVGIDDVELPIILDEVRHLDDLEANIRERVYRYYVCAWIPSHMADKEGKIITIPIVQVYDNTKPEDALKQVNKLLEVKIQPD